MSPFVVEICIGYYMRFKVYQLYRSRDTTCSVMSETSERGTKYGIVTRAISLILPRLEYDNLFIKYL